MTIFAQWTISIIGCSLLTALGWESLKKMADTIGDLQKTPKEEKIKLRKLKRNIKLFKIGYSACGILILLILYFLLDR